jgi:DNA-binding beta-propeller fold protein YncE
MRKYGLILVLAAATAPCQDPLSAQFDHRYTFGSKHGIHPRKVLSTRPAIAALGKDEHPYGLGYPVGVTTDVRRRVWITDSGTASVHVFDPESGAYREIRRAGDSPLQQPSGIVTDAVGRIYLTDSGSGGVYVFDENGEYDRSLFRRGERPLEAPTAIALSEDGRTIYVADPPRNVIVALNREGEVDSTIRLPEERSEPCAISVINNQLYVLAGRMHRVLVLSPAGIVRGELRWDGIIIPTAFAYNPLQRRFVAANPRSTTVQVFNEEGQNLGSFGQYGEGVDQMQHEDSLYIDLSGLVYVVDSHQGKVLVFAESRSQ